jgi:ribosomal-protein-serine acetyltransferase
MIRRELHGKMRTPFQLKVTDEIVLKVVEEQHAQGLFNLTDVNRQHLRKWLPWVDQTRFVADTSAFIALCSRQVSENNGFQVVIYFQDRLCGMIGHHGIDRPNRSTSMGYWLDASHQGKGIMTASCRAMINHAFRDLDLHRVVIRCATENRRSRAIPERLGFTLEGVARQSEWLHDHFVDLANYGLLRTDKQT